MNRIKVVVKEIQKLDSLHIVSFDFCGAEIKMMSLELDERVIVGQKVILAVKPSHVSFAKNFKGIISITNQFKGKIKGINKGKLLSSVTFEAEYTLIESVFTTSSLKEMNLRLHDEFLILIKASDISIKEICND